MCTVTIDINEAAVRRWKPDLSTHEDISRWAQLEMDKIVGRLADPGVAGPPCTYGSKEEVVAEARRRVDEIVSGRAVTVPHDEVRQRMERMIASYAG